MGTLEIRMLAGYAEGCVVHVGRVMIMYKIVKIPLPKYLSEQLLGR